ncbi:sensor histidine kinase [Helicobacter sp. MIT 00-7814]|uniref:sensor histidine kinase n=1 Tax=unclassified Helicobacter TaxID=2593540 RepID=UPI000E1F0209|nr:MULTISPECIES: ATP-binding protein [unclassified Helicobacter]RDU53913.1 sensor histidine kinase [Helicobacter sp. MIT 00-7814]RDU57043.1 sensor histidine kinase [Helicobacter sp. MIT 99-10781]
MFARITQKLQATSIQTKNEILLYIIVGIFLLCSFTGFLALAGLKADYDSNYPSQKFSVLSINEINSLYEDALRSVDSKQGEVQSRATQELAQIHLLWEEYKENLRLQDSAHRFLHTIKQTYQNLFLQDLRAKILALQAEQSALSSEIDSILSAQISKEHNKLFLRLLHINIELSSLNKEVSDSIYQSSLMLLGFFVLLLASLFFMLSKTITDSINNAYNSLESLVAQKTNELQILNANLQKSIEHEVKQNQQKDLLIYQQARLASMGEMIHNIAHQWRQPLNALTLLIQSFQSKFKAGKLDSVFIDSQTQLGLKIAKNMSETIESFSSFFRPNKEKSHFSVNKAILDSLELIKSVLEDDSIKVDLDIRGDYEVLGYENAFTQVLLVLLNNAIDAFRIRKVAKNQRHIQISIHTCPSDNDESLCIRVRDNAGGILLEDINKIFEPYFTTKHKAAGIGIGLYMAKQIVEKQFYGAMGVQNIEFLDGKTYNGALFSIIIPYKQNDIKEDKLNEPMSQRLKCIVCRGR